MAETKTDEGAKKATVRLSLKLKLMLLITTLLVLTVLLVSVFLLRQEQDSLTEEMTKRGLTIAREIIQRAGGTITISNRAGGGLQQVVELPRAGDAPR
jgi:sensor histidine kinase regulating citrate/malate metabolism